MRTAMQRAARLLPTSLVAWPWWPLLLSLVPALWQCLELLHDTPLSSDHPAHLFKAWHFWEEMLGRGRVRGWSHFWAFGFPSDELAPPGSEVWVCLFRALTFGQLSWLRTYALAYAGFLLLVPLSAYVFARSYLGRAASVGAAWIAALDPGGMLEGGWHWHTDWGVWPVTLAMSFVLLSLERFERVLSGARPRAALLAGLWFACALLTHHMALLTLAVALPILLADHALRPASLRAAQVTRALLGAALGLGLSAFFLVPFFGRSSFTQDLGWMNDGLLATAQKFVSLRTFQFLWAPIQGLSIVGAFLVLRRRLPGGLFLVLSWLALVVLSSGFLLHSFHLERLFPSLVKLEANRFLLVAKLFAFPLSAYGLVELVRPLVGALRTRTLRREHAAPALACGLLVVLLVADFQHVVDSQLKKQIVGESEKKYFRDLEKVLAWSRQERAASRGHYRIAYNMWRSEHLSTLAPVLDGTPMYKVGYTPVQIFEAFPMTGEDWLFEALSVKYVVSSTPLSRPTLTPLRQFGALTLYRFENYRPDPFTMIGGGQAKLLEFSPERIRIRVSGATAASRLKLHVARFPRWRARYGEKYVRITGATVRGVEYPWLMEVPAQNGELVFAYERRGTDRAGLGITLVALPSIAFALWFDRKRKLSTRAGRWLRRRARVLALVAGLLGLALVGLVAHGVQTRERLLMPRSLFRAVRSPADLTLDGKPCKQTAPLSFRCGDQRVRADASPAVWGVNLCMTGPEQGQLQLKVRTRLGGFLAGQYTPAKQGKGRIQVRIDGKQVANLGTRPAHLNRQDLRIDTRKRRREEALVEVTLTDAALHCFDLGVVD
jgi:hypothetical protein